MRYLWLLLFCCWHAMLHASIVDPRYYIGVEATTGILQYKSSYQNYLDSVNVQLPSKSTIGFGLYMGTRLDPYIGLEMGYDTFKKEESHYQAGARKYHTEFQPKLVYLEALGYLPIESEFDLYASIGLALASTHQRTTDTGLNSGDNEVLEHTFKGSRASMRFGMGLRYVFAPNVATRLVLRYQKLPSEVESFYQLALGLMYQF